MDRREFSRVEGASRGGWWLPVAAVSAVVVVIALAAAVILGERGEEVAPRPAAPLASRVGLAAKAALIALGSDEADFEAARAELLQVFEARRDETPEDANQTMIENLAIIEAQIAAISDELSRDPDNPRLARLLAEAYQEELELLQRAAALPALPEISDEG
ncbi:MAG: hypothetical protein V2I67_11940 [Thermoanaerobaculales bacterium]|jgi:hypothetical protein|nr:hypothetical protein [Thermoanaerobaculales bacterium]